MLDLRFCHGEIWMASDMPGQEAGPDQPEPTAPPSAPAPEPAPAWTTPPPASAPGGSPASGTWAAAPQEPSPPQQPAQPAPAWGGQTQQGQWGGQPQAAPGQPAPQGWGAPPPTQQTDPTATPQPVPQQPAQPGHWGTPGQPAPIAAQQPAPQGWGAPPAQQPAWNTTPQEQPAPPQPSQPGQWGTQPASQQGWAQQQPAQAQPVGQGQWAAPAAGAAAWNAAPPPQGAAPQPGWTGPGQPQPGWQGGPPPAKSGGNKGCIIGCLVVVVILVVLVVGGVLVLGLFTSKVVTDLGTGVGLDQNGNLKDCSIVSSAQLQTVLGKDTEAHPLAGLANAAIGLTLDKRVIPDADNCYILSGASTNTTQTSGGYGRIAKYSNGDASSVFDKERANAQSGQYFAVDVSNAGDQAFCTGWSDKYPATGALVRKGNDLVYVSLLIGSDFGSLNLDQASSATGVPYSQQACDQAVSIAKLALP